MNYSNRKICSIDSSTVSTGLSYFIGENYISSDLIALKDSDSQRRFNTMVSSIYKCLDSFLPDEVVIEEEAVIRNVQTTRLLVRLQGAIQGWCISHCVKCTFIRPSQWRSKVGIKTGRKKRAELKQEAINLIQENLKLNVNDDIAESILIGFAAINKDIKEKKHGEN